MYFSLYSIVFISLPLEVTFWYSIFVLFQLKVFPIFAIYTQGDFCARAE